MERRSDPRPLPVVEGYDRWAATYDGVINATRDAAAAKVAGWAEDFRGRAVLELGCGTGRNTGEIARRAASVTALDLSEAMLSEAVRRAECAGVRFLQHDLTGGLPFPASGYDVVLESLVLEHMKDLGPLFGEVFRVLGPGGAFLGSELHPYRQQLGKQARFQPAGSTEELLIEAHSHSISEFVNTALDAGFQIAGLEEDEEPSGALRLFSFRFLKPF